jgi:hypothetical protein
MNRACLLAAAVASSLGGACLAANVYLGAELDVEELGVVFKPCVYRLDWSTAEAAVDFDASAGEGGSVPFRLPECGGDHATVSGTARFSVTPEGALHAVYDAAADRDVAVNALCVRTYLPGGEFFGGTVDFNGERKEIPPEKGESIHVAIGVSQGMTVVARDGTKRLSLAFDAPAFALLQDNREWGSPMLEIRMVFGDGTLRAGERHAFGFTLSGRDPIVLHPAIGPCVITAGEEWIPLHAAADIVPGSALDFSTMAPRDKPAGVHGRVVSRGAHFEFESLPGEPQRFYGVNLCFGANFLSAEESEILAARLERIGYNAIRLHHHDGGLVEGSPDGTTLHPGRLAELDGLVAACIRHGIYVTTDLFVSRSVPWRSVGVDRDGNLGMDEFKLLAPVHEGVFGNLASFTRQFLSHVNPHTGRSYAEEPALAWLSLVNEDNPGNFGGDALARHPEWRDAWAAWLAGRRAANPDAFADVPDAFPSNLWNRDRAAAVFSLFLAGREEAFARRMTALLRDELGCHALVTDMNSWMNPASYQLVRARAFGYVDDHFYVDHPEFIGTPWRLPSRCPNANPFRGAARGAQGVAFTRLLDKPFTVTEYNFSAPGRYRGVGGIATGAMGALQDWAGIWRFAWAHSREGAVNPGGVPMDYFNMGGDPLSLAAERASICLFLRGDLAPLRKTLAIAMPPESFDGTFDPLNRPSWAWAAWYLRLGTLVAPAASSSLFDYAAPYTELYRKGDSAMSRFLFGVDELPADGPADWPNPVRIDSSQGAFAVATPATCGGFAERGVIRAAVLRADIGGTPATVWASSLDGKPLAESERILVTHLTDVQNTGIRYADARLQTLLAWGSLPHLMRAGRADVSLRLGPGSFEVRLLASDGSVREILPSTTDQGVLAFTADVARHPDDASYLYEIRRAASSR